MNVKVTKEALRDIAQKSVNIDQLNKRIEEIVNIAIEKNAAYGDSWQLYGPLTALIHIREKLMHLENISMDRGALVVMVKSCFDVEQEINDIIGYALLLSLWMDNARIQDDGMLEIEVETVAQIEKVSKIIKHFMDMQHGITVIK